MIRTCVDCNENRAAPSRTICYACKTRRYAKRNPVRYAFQKLRCNARRRGKDFDLTFEQFNQFYIRFDYMKKKGITSTAYHIDRIDENKGYTINNIQLLTNQENVRKYSTFIREYDWVRSEMTFYTDLRVVVEDMSGVPF